MWNLLFSNKIHLKYCFSSKILLKSKNNPVLKNLILNRTAVKKKVTETDQIKELNKREKMKMYNF